MSDQKKRTMPTMKELEELCADMDKAFGYPAPPNPGADEDKFEKRIRYFVSNYCNREERMTAESAFIQVFEDYRAHKESQMRERIAELEARKCSHGDYRMQGTTDCSKYSCGGRTEFYIIGEGLCLSCRHDAERAASGEGEDK